MKVTQEKAINREPVREPVEQPRIPSFILISVAAGGVLTALFYMLVVQLIYRGTYIEEMFTQRGPIPYMTTYFAFVALTQLGGLIWHLRRESRCLELVSEVLSQRSSVDIDAAPSIRREIYSYLKPSAQKGLVISRIRRVLHRIENKGQSSDVAALLSEQAEIDRAILSNSFASIRFIAWLIPILGFIGTIYGMSSAIAEFPTLFGQAAGEDIGKITNYLGIAFETTLLALIKVAIVQFVVFAVQKRGSQLLNASDEFCLDNLLGKVPHAGLIDEEDLPTSLRHFARILLHHVETMEERFEQAVQTVVDQFVENEQQRWSSFTDTFRAVAGEHETMVRQTCQSIKEKTEILSGEMRDFEPRLRGALQEITKDLRNIESERVQHVMTALADAGEKTCNALARAGQDNAEALKKAGDELRQGMEGMSGELREFQPSLRTFLEEVAKELREIESQHVQQVAIALTDAGDRTCHALLQVGQDNAGSLKTASDELRRGMENIEQLLKTSEELQTMQQTLNGNLATLTHMDQVRATLRDMSECTRRLIPVLQELQKRRRMQVRIEDEFEDKLDGSPPEELEGEQE